MSITVSHFITQFIKEWNGDLRQDLITYLINKTKTISRL